MSCDFVPKRNETIVKDQVLTVPPSSDLVVKVVELQSRVMSSVKRLHRLPAADGQGQREHGEPEHHERHHAALHRALRRHRLPLAGAGVLQDRVRLGTVFRDDDQTGGRPRGG